MALSMNVIVQDFNNFQAIQLYFYGKIKMFKVVDFVKMSICKDEIFIQRAIHDL